MKKLSLVLVLALMLFSFAACSSKEAAVPAGEAKTLTGTAKGFGGDITVTVTVIGDDITDVKAVGDDETKGVGSNAIDQLPALIVQADSTEVDDVSGATISSNAIKAAVKAALATK